MCSYVLSILHNGYKVVVQYDVQRKKRTHVPNYTDPAKKSDPKTFVFWRGKQGVRYLSLTLLYLVCVFSLFDIAEHPEQLPLAEGSGCPADLLEGA